MADITMCFGDNCPKKDNCYRFTATPNKYLQHYSNFESICEVTDYINYLEKRKISG